MITGGNATVYVSDMNRAVKFYTEVLDLKLVNRYGDDWTTVTAGSSLTIGLHPMSMKSPAPGKKGGIMLGLEIDEPVDQAVERLKARDVKFVGETQRTGEGNFAHLEDPDGNELYLWETKRG